MHSNRVIRRTYLQSHLVRLEELGDKANISSEDCDWLTFSDEHLSSKLRWDQKMGVMDTEVHGSERMIRESQAISEAWILDMKNSPVFFTIVAYRQNYWLAESFTISDGLYNETGKANEAKVDIRKARTILALVDGAAISLFATKMDKTSVFCAKIEELNGTQNRASYFMLNKQTGSGMRLLSTIQHRTCDTCLILEHCCRCLSFPEAVLYDDARRERADIAQNCSDPMKSNGMLYLKSWFQGAWTLKQAGDNEDYLTASFVFVDKKEILDKCLQVVLQTESMKILTPYLQISLPSSQACNTLGNLQRFSSSERPNACPVCSKRFKQVCHLREHMRCMHRSAGALTCGLCGKDFGIFSKLKRHMEAVHAQLRPFLCTYCHRYYKERSYLKEHLATVHGIFESAGKPNRAERLSSK
eukprot:Plantae.Rhodophyta-Purpureofilum_apyrenoidigerum.ctg7094.p1 GENE.Plantae.Rhodophyta-Purpureofilum_apyrenoidigerum.ctg7094~~Plantae.Rhodophyta-Purpureofilum_apyrenoidigerum.ctg7094.p1  ORF type:complete len:415 (+),score=41.04 Plantae.Rhodophyta-Purpureofilum_apyrenoidigerum.ctg7094:205-1449(+)